MTHRRHPETTVLPVHFEDRSGTEFEQHCFSCLRGLNGPQCIPQPK